MKPSFTVQVDIRRSLLRLTLVGFFDPLTVSALAEARNAAMMRFRCGPNQHVTLCDARDGMLSTAAVTAEFQNLLGDPRHRSRRLAYLTDRTLARVQASRVLDRKDIGFFSDEEQALSWLLAD